MKKRDLFLIVILALFLVGSIVIAEHVVTTSGGNTAISFYENATSDLYNISVNNTGVIQSDNTTQVNITIPTGLTFITDSNVTDVTKAFFMNTTTVLSWTNTSTYLLNATENKTFWFNLTGNVPGTYILTVTAVNLTGSADTNITVFINDTTQPFNISFDGASEIAFANLSQNWITLNLSVDDSEGTYVGSVDMVSIALWNATGLVNRTNTTMHDVINFTGLLAGIYYVNVTANDTEGNTNNTGSGTRTITLDRTNTTVTLGTNPVDNVNILTTSTVFDIKCSDNVGVSVIELWGNWSGSWALNHSNVSYINDTWVNVTVSGLAIGIYKWGVRCNDSAGNYNWSGANRTINIQAAATEETTKSSIGGGASRASYPTLDTGYQTEVYPGWILKFKINENSYFITIKDINMDSEQITLLSEDVETIIKLREEKKLELTGDNYYDFFISLHSLRSTGEQDYQKKARVTIQRINELAEPERNIEEIDEPEPETTEFELEESSLHWIWIVLIIFAGLLILYLGYNFYLKKKLIKQF
ncbi:MAG: hypothetical protein ABIH51_01000 [Patescibacteria group bacterium]